MAFDEPKRDDAAWGTRGFAAPEQHGFAAMDARSDIYAIGRLAGYLLTGAVLPDKTFEGELRCSGMVPEACAGCWDALALSSRALAIKRPRTLQLRLPQHVRAMRL